MVVFSPVNFPKAQHVTATAEYFGAGVKAKVLVTPAGWTQTYMLSAGHGINAGMMAWGDRMLTFTGKKRADMYAFLRAALLSACLPRRIFVTCTRTFQNFPRLCGKTILIGTSTKHTAPLDSGLTMVRFFLVALLGVAYSFALGRLRTFPLVLGHSLSCE